MNYYFIDYENVKHHGLTGIENICNDDSLIIFYSDNANTIPIDLMLFIKENNANIIFQKVDVSGKNSLDFQLISYLGYTMSENKDKDISYYIVTKDKEYNSLLSYWRSRGFNIHQVTDLQHKEYSENKSCIMLPVNDISIENSVFAVLGDKETSKIVAKCIRENNGAGNVHNAIMSELSRKIGNIAVTTIFNKIKHLIPDEPPSINTELSETSLPNELNLPKEIRKNTDDTLIVHSNEELKNIFDDNIKDETIVKYKDDVVKIIKSGTSKNQVNNELTKIFIKSFPKRTGDIVKRILNVYKQVLSVLPGREP